MCQCNIWFFISAYLFFSYAVSIGLIDALSKRCMKIREPIENHQSVVLSVLACLGLLTKFTDVCPKGLCVRRSIHLQLNKSMIKNDCLTPYFRNKCTKIALGSKINGFIWNHFTTIRHDCSSWYVFLFVLN